VLSNIQKHIDDGRIEFIQGDLLHQDVAEEAVSGIDVVFHLAAIHGGRGYVDLHQAMCAQNLALDGILIKAAREAGVDRVGPPYAADNMYGWAKLMTEMTLKHSYEDLGFKSASCRLFTVYGERGVENHAVMAMTARAFIGQNPFEVWGDGTQIRNWTYVGDIVSGMVLAAEHIKDGSAVNLGTEERIRVIDAVQEVLRYTGHEAEIRLRADMPTGPVNRVASNRLAGELFGWKPELAFIDGLHRTIDWYFSTKQREQVRATLQHMLTER
jgi:nucleoside-diphosphate-sugar epimerase